MKVLVTGGRGFVGRALLPLLAGRHEVWAACRTGAPELTAHANVVVCDLTRPSEYRALPAHIDAIVHLAQSSRYRDWPEEDAARDIFEVNVAATQALLDYALRARTSQFLLASTGSVYGPADMPLHESAATAPNGYYAASKLAAEVLVRPYSARLTTCALRLFYPYGPGQTGRLVGDLVERVASGRSITLQGDDSGLLLNPSYVEDVAQAIHAALSDTWQGTVNVAAPNTLSLRQIGEIIGKALGRSPSFEVLAGATPQPILPDLRELTRRLPSLRWRSFEDGIALTIGRAPRAASTHRDDSPL